MNPTNQQVFNVAWNGLKAQGWQKTGPWDAQGVTQPARKLSCLCAVHHASLVFETGVWGTEIVRGAGGRQMLQQAHDDATSPEDMQHRMRALAASYGLTIPGEADPFTAFMAKVREPVSLSDEIVTFPSEAK